MKSSLFDPDALYWLAGFVLIYALAHLFVSKSARFKLVSDTHKKITTKLAAIVIFTAVYLLIKGMR